MFQPARSAPRRPLPLIAGAVALVILLLVLAFVLLRGHGSSGTPTATPGATTQTLTGHFGTATMTCPGKSEIPGNTCVISLTLTAGVSRVTVTSPTGSLLALGIQDAANKELGPQVTGDNGSAIFVTPAVSAGTYRLRVVNVQLPSKPKTAFDFTVTIVTP